MLVCAQTVCVFVFVCVYARRAVGACLLFRPLVCVCIPPLFPHAWCLCPSPNHTQVAGNTAARAPRADGEDGDEAEDAPAAGVVHVREPHLPAKVTLATA